MVGTSHPRGFCLQGFPPCCWDTIYASAPPSERNRPSHLLHTWKHQNNPCIQANNRCARINAAICTVCATRARWPTCKARPESVLDFSAPNPETWEEATSKGFKWTDFVVPLCLHSQVLSTIPSATIGSRKGFFAEAKVMQRDVSNYSLTGFCLQKNKEYKGTHAARASRCNRKVECMRVVDLMLSLLWI